eukprot:3357195-Prorocentrum_lima.AAC.1
MSPAWRGETRFFIIENESSPFKALPQALQQELDDDGQKTLQELELPSDPYTKQGGLTEDTADFWEKKGRLWIRHHVRPRLTAFTPDNAMPGGPELQLLDSNRETRRRRLGTSSSCLLYTSDAADDM